jgi:membrane protein
MDDVQTIERAAGERGAAPPPDSWPEAGPDLPPHAWKQVVRRVYDGIAEDRILMNAAGVTFYALLALFPAIAALVSIYGLFADPATIAGQLDTLSGILPGGGLSVIRDQLTRVATKGSGSLTIGFVVGLAVSLWSANGGLKGLFDALNMVYGAREKRGFIRLNAISLAFALAIVVCAVAALVGIVAIPKILASRPSFSGAIIDIARWPAMAILATVCLACIYHIGPSRETPQWRWISWGSFVAAVLWLAGSWLFSHYAAHFGTFDKTYGSLGAVIGFMLWIWLSIIMILLGGKLNAEIERAAGSETAGPRGTGDDASSG